MPSRQTTVLYDGDCAFCEWCRRFVERRDSQSNIKFVDMQSDELAPLVHEYGLDIDRKHPESIVIITPANMLLHKWHATYFILRQLRSPYRQLTLLLAPLPAVIGDWLYDFVADHRLFFCKLVRCTERKPRRSEQD